MKQQADKQYCYIHFNENNMVLVKLQPYCHTSLLELIGPVAFCLQLPVSSQIHLVFHASLLKPYKCDPNLHPSPLPPKSWLSSPILQPTTILNTRQILQGTTTTPCSVERLSHWNCYLANKYWATWGLSWPCGQCQVPRQMDIDAVISENIDEEEDNEDNSSNPIHRQQESDHQKWLRDYSVDNS